MYRELTVEPRLAGVLDAVWVRDTPGDTCGGAAGRDERIVPDGCTDLMWVDGTLLLAGPDTRAHPLGEVPGSAYVAVRFVPGAGPAVFGVPAHELRDARVPLDALWPAGQVRRIADQVTAAEDRPAALQAATAARLHRAGEPDPVAAAVTAYLRAGRGVADTARATGLSERQLHRRCLAAFGYGPKTLGRILRFRHALALARAGLPFAEVAVTTGYADQAHLAREVRALAGVPLRALLPPPIR